MTIVLLVQLSGVTIFVSITLVSFYNKEATIIHSELDSS